MPFLPGIVPVVLICALEANERKAARNPRKNKKEATENSEKEAAEKYAKKKIQEIRKRNCPYLTERLIIRGTLNTAKNSYERNVRYLLDLSISRKI